MKAFTYIVPRDLKEAAEAGARKNTAFKAAGTDIVDRMKERQLSPENVVSLLPLKAEMAGIRADAGAVTIGALTTLTQLEESPLLTGEALAAIRQAAATTATPLIRNRGTVGGNLLQLSRCWYLRSAAFECLHDGRGEACLAMYGENRYHAVMGYRDCVRVHPSNLAPALIALDAEVSVFSGGGTRRIKVRDLYPKDPKGLAPEHVLKDGEILTAVHVPPQPDGTRSVYDESREKLSFDWATTAAAVRVRVDGGTIREASICLGAVGPNPVPADDAAEMLIGKEPSAELFAKVADEAFADAAPLSQNEYKIPVGKAVLRDALAAAAGTR